MYFAKCTMNSNCETHCAVQKAIMVQKRFMTSVPPVVEFNLLSLLSSPQSQIKGAENEVERNRSLDRQNTKDVFDSKNAFG